MSTDDIDIDNVEEEGALDRVLFLIKDELPKDVVDNIYQPLAKLRAVRNILDMVAFVLIEFNTKLDKILKNGQIFDPLIAYVFYLLMKPSKRHL